jgi:hypothetical protein
MRNANIQTVIDYLREIEPGGCNFSVNYEWLMKTLESVQESNEMDVLLNPAYLRAEFSIGVKEPPVFDTW